MFMELFGWVGDPQAWIALATLAAIEIVLGIDNIIFISILVGRLPEHQRNTARTTGLMAAMVTRLGLLLTLAWIMKLTAPLFTVVGREISGRDLILICGGLFLLWKSVHEIHNSLEGTEHEITAGAAGTATFGSVLAQIAVIDIIFSLDSVITAVGMVDEIGVMISPLNGTPGRATFTRSRRPGTRRGMPADPWRFRAVPAGPTTGPAPAFPGEVRTFDRMYWSCS
jgi:predicted tellurium resistance membrane protein TerC